MTVFTYNTLSAGLQAWVEDDGDDFTSNIDTVISLGQDRLVRDLNLDIFKGNQSGALIIGGNSISKPMNCLELEDMYYINSNGERKPILSRSRSYCVNYSPNPATQGPPRFYYEDTDLQWTFVPAADMAYPWQISFLTRPAPLNSGNQSNWLSNNAGDILFYACLAETEQFLMGDDRVTLWKSDYGQKIVSAREELINLTRKGNMPFPDRIAPNEQSEVTGAVK